MTGSVFDGDDTEAGILWVLSSIGAANWGLVEFADLNLVSEVVSATNPTVGTALYGLIGLAGVLALADNLGFYNIIDVVDSVKGDD
jgi:uncharacterized membrane protein YuzA (DUF378 family)